MDKSDKSGRRETRTEIYTVIGALISLLAPLTSALGFSPLTKIWSIVAILIGSMIVFATIYYHDRGTQIAIRAAGSLGREGPFFATLRRPPYLIAVVAILLVSGAWLQANLGNLVTLAIYGSLSDLDVRPPAGIAQPSTISLRRNGADTCFFTETNFDLRNSSSVGLYIGVISASLDMQDNANAPVLIPHNSTDFRTQNAYLSGLAIVTGPAEGWATDLAQNKDQLTFLRPGQSTRVTVRQESWSYNNCVPDPDSSIMKNYDGTAVRVTAGIAIVRPDGTVQRQDISTGDLAANVQRQ
jgi:hypothetical protein